MEDTEKLPEQVQVLEIVLFFSLLHRKFQQYQYYPICIEADKQLVTRKRRCRPPRRCCKKKERGEAEEKDCDI